MTIAYIFSDFYVGGTEEYAITLARKARDGGHEPIFIISRCDEAALKKIEGFEIIHLAMNSSFNPFSVAISVLGIKKILAQRKINIVHANMLREHSLAIFVKIFSRHKFVLVRSFHRQDNFNFKMRLLLPIYLRYTDRVIAISDLMTKLLDKNGWRGKWTLILNGGARVNAKEHDLALGFIGRLSPEKGIFNFIKNNRSLLKNCKMVIAGDGPDFDAIKDYVKNNKLKVELLGSIVDKSIFYKKAAVLVLPSSYGVTPFEVMPLVILEAYSCGMPVVAFKSPPLVGLVTEKTGSLVEDDGNYKLLGFIASDILRNTKKYHKNNMDLYEKLFSEDIMWNNTSNLYQELVRSRKK